MAEQRVYEVVFIVDPDAGDDEVTRQTENFQQVVADRGGRVTRTEVMGRRQLAYKVGRKTEGVYVLMEVEGTGAEIAEMERRMRVSDPVLRYLTVRVDEDRRRAEKFKARRAARAARRPFAGSNAAGASRAGERQAAPAAGDGGEA